MQVAAQRVAEAESVGQLSGDLAVRGQHLFDGLSAGGQYPGGLAYRMTAWLPNVFGVSPDAPGE